MSKLTLIPVVLFTALAGMFAGAMFFGQGEELASNLIDRPAPELNVTPMEGQPVLTDAILRDGEVKVVNFWASWCAPCRVEHPNLMVLAEEGVAIYGVNYKDTAGNALSFLNELDNPYRAIGVDAQGVHALDWGVYGVPETFVLAGDGTVVLRMASPVTQRELDARLRPALEAARER